ncbi:uncharacterized protein LOC106135659 [Amyelois transitella]|uniref:uncharacterized protein LOC106135659 n=1 Tax=Amyelois transitella TaxID=680683 RepID=UPI0029900E83|nr:uncharacterized protein LOC106135659 [Amyelois transitella]
MRGLFCFIVLIILYQSCYGMTRAQLKKTLTIVKKQCVPKIGVSEDKIDKIEQGVFIEDRKVMCYVTCVYKNMQVVRNDKLNQDLINKQVEALYPADMKSAVKKGVDHCMPVQEKYNDVCERVFYGTKCLYEYDPPNFVSVCDGFCYIERIYITEIKMLSKINLIYFLCVLFTLKYFGVNGMTRQQVKNSGKLMKKTCMPKNDVTEEQVGDIDKGKFLEEKNVMCYIACIYSVGGALKNNKIIHEAMIKQVDMMFPADMKDAVKETIEKCRGVAKQYKDICEAAFATAKCMYEADPPNFLFP